MGKTKLLCSLTEIGDLLNNGVTSLLCTRHLTLDGLHVRGVPFAIAMKNLLRFVLVTVKITIYTYSI